MNCTSTINNFIVYPETSQTEWKATNIRRPLLRRRHPHQLPQHGSQPPPPQPLLPFRILPPLSPPQFPLHFNPRQPIAPPAPCGRFFADSSASAMRSQGLILNTSNSLEAPILSKIRSLFPTTYTVGPLHALVESITSSSVSASLLVEDRSALSWLDAQPDLSVVYVSFGSLTRLTLEEFLEFWHGFVDSGHRFLWVVRPDMVAGGAPAIEMTELEERLRLVAWAPQQEVLRHRAVGCFFTHSGWNSTVESAAAAVPMVCWPWSWDQLVNSRLVGEVWKVGLDMKDICRREMVERMVRESMEGEKAEKLRRVAAEMAAEIGRSVGEGGDSRLDFERLVRDILSLSLRASVDRGPEVNK